jgi:hypothetical protein
MDQSQTQESNSPQEYEPLLPAEKWLIGVSLTLGVTLLIVLKWFS